MKKLYQYLVANQTKIHVSKDPAIDRAEPCTILVPAPWQQHYHTIPVPHTPFGESKGFSDPDLCARVD
jgi:hypothetical protein